MRFTPPARFGIVSGRSALRGVETPQLRFVLSLCKVTALRFIS